MKKLIPLCCWSIFDGLAQNFGASFGKKSNRFIIRQRPWIGMTIFMALGFLVFTAIKGEVAISYNFH